MSVRETIKSQIIGALKKADFPIVSPEALLNAFAAICQFKFPWFSAFFSPGKRTFFTAEQFAL